MRYKDYSGITSKTKFIIIILPIVIQLLELVWQSLLEWIFPSASDYIQYGSNSHKRRQSILSINYYANIYN